jgi:DNA-binding transcriptional MerR regulator
MSLYIGDAAKALGVSTATLKRWFRNERVRDVARDRNGYRVFEPEDIERLRAFVNQRFEPSSPPPGLGSRQRVAATN